MLPFHAAPALDSGLCQYKATCWRAFFVPTTTFPAFQHLAASPRTNHMATLRSYSPSVPSSVVNFKPTPREVLGGIAPHLFEERPRRRSSSRTRSEVHLPPTHKRNVSSSPLRVSAILTAWDENGQLMGRSEQELEVNSDDSDSDEPLQTTVTCTLDEKGAHVETETSHSRSIMKVDKTRLKSLKISRGLRTIVIKLSHFYCPPRRPALRSY